MLTGRCSAPRPLVLLVLLAVFSPAILGACSTGGPGPAPTQAQTSTTTSTVASPTSIGPTGATVTLGRSAFSTSAVSLSAGQLVRIVDPSTNGGTHILCLGANGQCDASAQGPDSLLGPGLSLHPGDTKEIVFPTAGMYDVTCTIHPNMHLTISVLGGG